MAICPADMDDCFPKRKCIFGPNEGKAYNPNDPCCGVGVFDSSTCDCVIPNGWVYNRQVTTGFCYDFSSGVPSSICEGSYIVNEGRTYYGNYNQGDPTPTLAWEASLAWEVAGETSGMMALGDNIVAELEPETSTTSDDTPWNAPPTNAVASGDSSACTETFTNCGAVRLGNEVANSILYFDVLAYPEDKEGYCLGLDEDDCFYKAYDDYGPGGS